MKLAFQAIVMAVLLLVTAETVFATHGIAFSQSACYHAPLVQQQVNYGYQSYEQAVVLPLSTYGYNQPANLIVLPQKVTVTRPEITLELEQVQPTNYVFPQEGYVKVVAQVDDYGCSIVQQQNGGYAVLQQHDSGWSSSLGVFANFQQAQKFRQQFRANRQQFRQKQLEQKQFQNFVQKQQRNDNSRRIEIRGPFGGKIVREVQR